MRVVQMTDAEQAKGMNLQGDSSSGRASVLASIGPLSTRQIHYASELADRQIEEDYSLEYRPIPLKFK